MGTRNRSFVEVTELIGRKTGGVSFSPWVAAQEGMINHPVVFVMVRLMGERVLGTLQGSEQGEERGRGCFSLPNSRQNWLGVPASSGCARSAQRWTIPHQ